MIYVLGTMGLVTVIAMLMTINVSSLMLIDFYSGICKKADLVLLVALIVMAIFFCETFKEALLWGILFVICVGIQQECFISMRKMFVDYIREHCHEAKFTIESIIDGVFIGWVTFGDDDDMRFDAAYVGNETHLEPEKKYDVDLYIQYNSREVPSLLLCTAKSDTV